MPMNNLEQDNQRLTALNDALVKAAKLALLHFNDGRIGFNHPALAALRLSIDNAETYRKQINLFD